jgi:superfamily II DNA/RNA helicase
VGGRIYLTNACKAALTSLICSDLIARGIDLPSVSHVISYDAPVDMRKYVHRVGRTARAGKEGTAWTLVEKQEVRVDRCFRSVHVIKSISILRRDTSSRCFPKLIISTV